MLRIGRKRRKGFWLALFVLVLFDSGPSRAVAQVQPQSASAEKSILFLYAFEAHLPVFEKTNRGILAALETGGVSIRSVFFEYLDLARNTGPEHRKRLAELIRQRYSQRKIDMIVTLYPEALRFVINEGRAISPAAPILALYLPQSFQLPKRQHPIVPHSAHDSYDLVGTLEAALKLVPGVKHVYVVCGAHENDRALEKRIRRDLKLWEDRLEFRYLSDMPLETILATLSSTPPETIVFFGTFSADVSGRNYTSREVVQRLSRISSAPVFGLHDVLLGYGIVGGSLLSFERTGAEAGKMILSGLPTTQGSMNPVTLTVPAVPMFDWQQLRRWNLSVDAVPPGSVVINREYTLWEQYRWEVIGGVGLLVVQALLILALLVQQQQRRKAEETLRENEERLRLAMGAAALGAWSWDIRRDRFRLSDLVGKAVAQPLTADTTYQDVLAIVHTEDREGVDAAVQQAIQTGKEYEIEYRIPQADGTVQWISSRGSCSYDRAGTPLRMSGVSHDITDRKRAEEERQLLAAVVEASHDAILSVNLDGQVTSWNPGAERLFEYTAAEVKGQPVWFLVPAESREETARVLERVKAGEAISWETVRCRKDGTRLDVSVTSAPLRNAAGDIVGLTTTLRDITARKRAEEKIRGSEAKYRELYESLRDGFVIVSMDGRIKEFNDRFREMTGYASDELLKMTYQDLTPEPWHDFEQTILEKQVLARGYSDVYEKDYRRKDGTVSPVELRTFLVRDATGGPSGMWAIVRDITQRKRAEAALRESEERFRQVAENVADFIWEVDAQGLYRYTSPSVEKILGYRPDELVGKLHFYDLFAPEVRDELKAATLGAFAAKQAFRAFPNPNVRKDGRVVHLETSGGPVLDAAGQLLGYRGADTDVTERKRAEGEADRLRRELAHMSRVTMLGELTASLAHELNQPLTAIVSNAHAGERYLMAPTPPLGEVAEILADVAADAQRAGETIRRMRSLLKKDTTRFGPLDVNEIIREVVALTQTDALIRHQPIALALAPDLPPVRGDRVQLQQVLLNLVLNGMEAMGAAAPAARRLRHPDPPRRPRRARGGPRSGPRHPPGQAGDGLRVLLHDEGERPGPGPRHQPLHRRGARRPHLGREPPGVRRHLLVQPPGVRPRLVPSLHTLPSYSTI